MKNPKCAIDGSQRMVRTAVRKTVHRKLISAPVGFQKPPKSETSPNKHKLKGPSGKYMSASEKAEGT